jgi:tRNA-specific 2-thiouridylase
MEKKGILLYSGGLDSLLAGKILLGQGIEIITLHFILPFRHIRCGTDYMKLVENPPHGHGKRMNPCIDCKIYFLSEAKKVMIAENASFVATGEVVGQRPMSQMKNILRHIEKESGLEGYLLRPLSAKLLKPTAAETEGIVDRKKLFGISGRGRHAQMRLADEYGITEYSSPAGGCQLTDQNIAARMRDLIDHHPGYNMDDVYLLTLGRHYRINGSAKIIVGRNESENIELEKYTNISDFFLTPDFKGPSVFIKGLISDEEMQKVSSIVSRHSKCDISNDKITVMRHNDVSYQIPAREPISDEALESCRIN